MPFYKFIMKTGRCGAGNNGELAICLYSPSYTKAMGQAKKFAAVKHGNFGAIISSKQIEEIEFVVGELFNGYHKLMEDKQEFRTLQQNARTLSYIKDYTFQTPEGKQLKEFCDAYNKADNKQKQSLENKYKLWAMEVIRAHQNEVYYGF